jgi:hypothetical protein
MDPALAQVLVDGFAALALLAYALRVGGHGRRSAVQGRLRFVFLLAGLFYALRALFHFTGAAAFEALTLVLAGALPLGGLLLAEQMVRRHAPRLLKVSLLAGALTGPAAAVFREAPWAEPALAAYVVGGLTAVLVLALVRDRASLTTAENGALRRMTAGLVAVAALAATDFVDAAPVGLSGLGVLALVHGAAGASIGGRGTAAVLGVALWLAAGAAAALGLSAWTDVARLAAVVLAGLGALAVLLRLQAGHAEARRLGLLRTLAAADTASLEAFLATATRHSSLADLTILEESDLAAYHAPTLARAFDASPVLGAGQVADPATRLTRDAREQLADLMRRHAASHAIRVTERPLRLALAATEATRAGDDVVELLIFQRLAAVAAERSAR